MKSVWKVDCNTAWIDLYSSKFMVIPLKSTLLKFLLNIFSEEFLEIFISSSKVQFHFILHLRIDIISRCQHKRFSVILKLSFVIIDNIDIASSRLPTTTFARHIESKSFPFSLRALYELSREQTHQVFKWKTFLFLICRVALSTLFPWQLIIISLATCWSRIGCRVIFPAPCNLRNCSQFASHMKDADN